MEYQLANRMQRLRASEIREILKVTEKPEIISFAGGLPAPECFPVEEIKEINRLVLEEEGEKALQYTTTEGYQPLRRWIADRMIKKTGAEIKEDNIILTHGSQQALDLTGKLFLDNGDVVLCESPTYLAAISAFRSYECDFVEVPTDEEGMLPEELERILDSVQNIKLIYVIPEFQNPTGRTWSLKRRKQLMKAVMKHKIVIIEDNPYGELRFEGDALPSLKSMDEIGCVISLGTFSKIFCPGYRIGWITADTALIDKYVIIKQSTDLQCNTMAQREIAKYLERYDIDEYIKKILMTYKRRRDIMLQSMEEEFPKEVTFTRPQGGLFAWVELPTYMDSKEVLENCLKRNVAFVPGGPFFPNGGNEHTFRLNFSNMPEEKIIKGIKCIAEVIMDLM